MKKQNGQKSKKKGRKQVERKKAVSIYDTLNNKQREAVFHTEGPLLILAGAGSGKTRVLTHRIAYLIEEKNINPWNILAITFTNKAAGEMRERVDDLVGYGSESIWVSTFHSACVRILRRHIEKLGYGSNFTIYDTDDQKTLMKDVCKKLALDPKVFKERAILSAISKAKNERISAQEYRQQTAGDYGRQGIARAYVEYEKQMKLNNALDFDDLLGKTVDLFLQDPEVLQYYQNRFRYIMVDEYQDTNTVQFEMIRLLAKEHRNLCVVGDDDQSIYKFRGANIKNILDFEMVFQDACVIKLEQNYRSTKTILDAANSVIRNNRGRKEKTLWTENEEGNKICLKQFESGFDEAEFIAADIEKSRREQQDAYRDYAVLYRTNAQSRTLEERFVAESIPYKIVGGVNFYARREIKDILSYLKTIDNGQDDLAVRRIINVPKRGIGLTTVNRIQGYAEERGIGFYEAIRVADWVPGIGRGLTKVESFAALIEFFKAEANEKSIRELTEDILKQTEYLERLKEEEGEEADSRIENIQEFISKIVLYEEDCESRNEPATLSGFLEEVALVADVEEGEEERDYVILMTLHSAKGLEFPHVYLAGMEDGLFPSYMTITEGDEEELEEERRLCYVGITRARKTLTLTCARKRMIRGEFQFNKMSRFLQEIPRELMGLKEGYGKGNGSAGRGGFGQTAFADRNFRYRELQRNPFTASKTSRNFGDAGAKALDYQVGDRVKHGKFGEGTVMQMVKGGRDYEVTVDFDVAGTKKMFAAFARLEKV